MEWISRLGLPICVVSLLVSVSVSLHAAEAFTSAYISEVMCVNQRGLTDDNGERSPWIELHNGGSAVVNLAGWFLTDDTNQLTKWRFPAVSVLPDKYLVVFASGKSRITNAAWLHVSFRLLPTGGRIALVNPSTNIVASIVVPKTATDVSFGCVRGEPAIKGIFVRPTPGKPNTSAGPGFAPEVVFSRAGGTFIDSVTLKLSAGAAMIHYTMDGTLPNTNSLAYITPIEISNTTQVRARAYQPGLLPGPPRGESYLKLHTNVLDFTSSLPLLVMDTLGKDVPTSQNETFVQLSIYEPVNGKASLTNAPSMNTRAGFRVRGSTSAGLPQQGFAVQFLDEFNDEQNRPILGLPSESDWILYAPNLFDPVMIHNPFVHQLSRDLGQYSPRTRFVEVFLVRSSGRVRDTYYNGIYVLIEKIKVDKHRVDIDKIKAEDLTPPKVTGGYLMKFDRVGPGEGGFAFNGVQASYVEPREQVINLPQRAAQKQYLVGWFNEFASALNGPNWLNPSNGYRAFLNLDAAIDYHLLEVLSGNVDSMVLSSYFHKPRSGRIVPGPHWDFDRALGSTDGRDANPRQWNTGPFFGAPWWSRVLSDPDAWQKWVDRWQELRLTHLSLTNMHGLIDRLVGELREAQPREYKKWNFQPRGGSYQAEVDLMKSWLSNRVDFIDRQLVPRPAIATQSGNSDQQLLLNAPTNVTIHYTLDGSDPRLPQGGVSSNALTYKGPIDLKGKPRIVARGYNSGQRQEGGPPISSPWSRPLRFP